MVCKDIPSVLLNTGSCVSQVGSQVEETVAVRIEVQIYDMVAVGSGPEGGARQRGWGWGGEQGSVGNRGHSYSRGSHTIQRRGVGLVPWGRTEQGLAVCLTCARGRLHRG